jgi:hypothetical protein
MIGRNFLALTCANSLTVCLTGLNKEVFGAVNPVLSHSCQSIVCFTDKAVAIPW